MKEKYQNKFIFALFLAFVITLGNLALSFKNTKECQAIIKAEDYDGMTIVLDMGHGDFDGGAVAEDGTMEKDINLEIGIKLRDLLKLSGYTVITTRSDDNITLPDTANTIREKKLYDMENRLNILKNNPNAIFISIHQNKFPDSSIKGAQVFYNDKKEKSQALASCIQKSLKEIADNDNTRVAKSSGKEYYLLEYSENCGVIIECGFISNPTELTKLKDSNYQKKIALAILKGIDDFISEDIKKSEV